MKERENIILTLQSNLWKTCTGVKLVARNLRMLINLQHFPAVFIRDLGDDVIKPLSRPREYERAWTISLISIVQGTTEDSAPQQLATFQELVINAVHKTGLYIGTTYKGYVKPVHIEPLSFPTIGNMTVSQAMQFEIFYIEKP
jgi:hypothetical protein